MNRYSGKVVWFSDKRGYGFVADSDGVERFFHYTALKMDGFRTVRSEAAVTFSIGFNDKGEIATDVELV